MPGDNYVSPYLLRPLRSYEEALRDRKRHNPRVEPSGDCARDRSSAAVGSENANFLNPNVADDGR